MGKYILKFPFIATIGKKLYLDKIVLKFGQLLSETEISIYCRDKGTPPSVMEKYHLNTPFLLLKKVTQSDKFPVCPKKGLNRVQSRLLQTTTATNLVTHAGRSIEEKTILLKFLPEKVIHTESNIAEHVFSFGGWSVWSGNPNKASVEVGEMWQQGGREWIEQV